MDISLENQFQTTVAKRIAGEDLQVGDIVTILNEVVELPSFLWDNLSSCESLDEPVRINYHSRKPGFPYRVAAVCLPFVYVQNVCTKILAFDIRLTQLVRLDRQVGEFLWKELRKQSKKKSKQTK